MVSVDVVEFAEKFMNVRLLEYQKRFLRDLENLRSKGDIRIAMGPKGQVYIYLDNTTRKELALNGATVNYS